MPELGVGADNSDGGALSSIFVVGNSRSGTTLMARIVGRHSSVLYLPETHFFGELWEPDTETAAMSHEQAIRIVCKLLSRVRKGYYWSGAASQYRTEAAGLVEGFSSNPWELFSRFQQHLCKVSDKQIACEQTPKNLYYLDRILSEYPQSRAICMIRDPRDVLLSQRQRWRRRWLGAPHIPLFETARAWANYHPVTTSRIWRSAASRVEAFREHAQCKIVRYEDLVGNPDLEIQEIMRFLDLEFESQQLSVPQAGSSAVDNVDESPGLRADRAGAWKHYGGARADIQICQSLCQEMMERFGYRMEVISYSRFAYVCKYFTLPFQLIGALLLNIGRWKKLGVAIRQRIHTTRLAG